MHIEDIKNLTEEERTEVFAKLNNKDLELLAQHASVELQDRVLREGESISTTKRLRKESKPSRAEQQGSHAPEKAQNPQGGYTSTERVHDTRHIFFIDKENTTL